MHALEGHPPSFRSEFDWIEYSWKETLMSHFTQVVDCLAYASTILQRTHMFPYLASKGQVDVPDALVHECCGMNARLDKILDNLQRVILGPFSWPPPSRMVISFECKALGSLFPAVFHFPGLDAPHYLCSYEKCGLCYG